MSVHFEWFNDQQTIIYAKIAGEITAEEFILTVSEIKALVQTTNHPVDLIIDQRELKKIPNGMLSIIRSQGRNVTVRRIVQVGPPAILKSMRQYLVYIPTIKNKIPMVADTLEEALELLEATPNNT